MIGLVVWLTLLHIVIFFLCFCGWYLSRELNITKEKLKEVQFLRRLGEVEYMWRKTKDYQFIYPEPTPGYRRWWEWTTRWNWFTGNATYDASSDTLRFYPKKR
jgi:hypothetical protein